MVSQARIIASGGLQPLMDLLKKEGSLKTKGVAAAALGMFADTDATRVTHSTVVWA